MEGQQGQQGQGPGVHPPASPGLCGPGAAWQQGRKGAQGQVHPRFVSASYGFCHRQAADRS